jgi:hypothetical protein
MENSGIEEKIRESEKEQTKESPESRIEDSQ